MRLLGLFSAADESTQALENISAQSSQRNSGSLYFSFPLFMRFVDSNREREYRHTRTCQSWEWFSPVHTRNLNK